MNRGSWMPNSHHGTIDIVDRKRFEARRGGTNLFRQKTPDLRYLLLTIYYLGWGSFDSAFGFAQDFRFASACANDRAGASRYSDDEPGWETVGTISMFE
ncbi:hypothetical protein ES703_31634 [subsurface metagenome]